MHLNLKITDLIPLSLISFCIHTVWGLKIKTAGLCSGLVLSSQSLRILHLCQTLQKIQGLPLKNLLMILSYEIILVIL